MAGRSPRLRAKVSSRSTDGWSRRGLTPTLRRTSAKLASPRAELPVHLERAVLVSVALPDRPWVGPDPLEELRGLATTAGAIVVGGLMQKREAINPGTYIGKGKLQELEGLVKAADAD